MTALRYCVYVIPAQHKPAGDLIMALVNGDDPAESFSFGRGANADGSYNSEEFPYETATHFFGGMPITEAWESEVAGLAENLPTPSGGYPWNGITEQNALDAAQAIYLQISITQDGVPPSGPLTLANAMSNLGLVAIEV